MSGDIVLEEVPRLLKRGGDAFISGYNNSCILLGRDRVDSIDSGYGSAKSPGGGKSAGAIHAIVGRKSQNPSVSSDSATIFMSMKTDVDALAGTNMGEAQKAVSGIVLRADCVRLSPRKDFKLSVGSAYLMIDSSGNVVIEGNVSLGKDAAQRMLLGDEFSKFWNTVTVPTPMGPSGPPPPIPKSAFSSTNKLR